MKCLHTKGWNRDNILTLLEFVDWIIKLPEPLEEQCCNEIDIFEEEMKVAYVTSWERYGIKKGEANMLLRQLLRKFKIVPDAYCQKIEQADADTLLVWGDRVLDCNSLDDIFKA